MTIYKSNFVSFEPIDNSFRGYLSIEATLREEKEPELLLNKAEKIYETKIKNMRSLIAAINTAKANHKPISARKIWTIGNSIISLKNELSIIGLELDGIYDHLVRDLSVKKKWLEKLVILRRYLPNKSLIPELLNWGRIEKGTRRKAIKLKSGLPID